MEPIIFIVLIFIVLIIIFVVLSKRKKVTALNTSDSESIGFIADSGVNVKMSNWRQTGQNVLFPEYQLNVYIEWTDTDGVRRSDGPRTIKFPDILFQLPPAKRAEVLEGLQEIMLNLYRDWIGAPR